MKTGKNEVIEQSSNQRDPYRARPEDFEIIGKIGDGKEAAGNGQCSEELRQQFAERNMGSFRGPNVDDAAPPKDGKKLNSAPRG